MTRLGRWAAFSLVIGLGTVAGCALAPQAAGTVTELGTQVAGLTHAATSVPTQDYVVQAGDTPLGVALKFGTSVQGLIELNAATHPEMSQTPMKFNAGWHIRVPKGFGSGSATGGSNIQVIQSSATEFPAVQGQTTGSPGGTNGVFDEAGALEIIQLTNAERAKAGLGPLAMDETLMQIARKRAMEIVTDWGHQGLDDDCSDCGENIVKGGDVVGEFQWWMGSDGHRGGILWPAYAITGVGRYITNGKAYVVQLFK